MSIEGQVAIALKVSGSAVMQASIASQRPLLAQSLLAGKPANEVTDLVALVFRLCGRAQAFAASNALEAAQMQQVSSKVLLARYQLLRMELIREHLWRILLDWPTLMGLDSQGDLMKQVLAFDKDWAEIWDADNLVFKAGEHVKPVVMTKVAGLNKLCGEFLNEHVFYMPPKTFYDCQDVEQLLLWARYTQTGAARLLQWLIGEKIAQVGDMDAFALPDLQENWLQEKLEGSGAEAFMQCPDIDGAAYETTPLARQKDHPLLQGLIAKFGVGLLTRYMAVLLEVSQSYVDMEKGLVPEDNNQEMRTENCAGLGVVEAARGRLIHRVILDNDKVKTYQIVAPTEWNFHPNGVLQHALKSLKGDAKSLEKQAKLLIHAMDPCVKYTLEIHHA